MTTQRTRDRKALQVLITRTRVILMFTNTGVFCRYYYILVINLVLLFERLNFIRDDVALRLRFKIKQYFSSKYPRVYCVLMIIYKIVRSLRCDYSAALTYPITVLKLKSMVCFL